MILLCQALRNTSEIKASSKRIYKKTWQRNIMKKYFRVTFLTVFLMIVAFGLGVFGAEMRIRFFSAAKKVVVKAEQKVVEGERAVSVPLFSASNIEEGAASSAPENIVSGTIQDDQGSFSFAIVGDTKVFSAGNPSGNLQRAAKAIASDKVNFSFVMGDLIQSCDGGAKCEGKFNDWKNAIGPLVSNMYEVVGNHDRTGGDKADVIWQKEFNLPTNGPAGYSELVYSFDYGNSHFVVLDSEKPQEHVINSVQRNWLEQDLTANKKEHTFVFFHEPAYQTAQNKKDGLDADPQERDALWNILVKHKVTAVFNGHEHLHTRKKVGNIYQIVIGDTNSTDDDFPQPGLSDYSYKGKSFGIVTINSEKVNLKMYTVDGKELNSFDF